MPTNTDEEIKEKLLEYKRLLDKSITEEDYELSIVCRDNIDELFDKLKEK